MRILIHSNAPWAGTGYGQQTGQLAKQLQADGHDVAVSCFYGLHGNVLNWNGIVCLPGAAHPYGNDVILNNARAWFGGDPHGGLIITLVDVWVLDAKALQRHPVACWTPVDHDPAPPAVVDMLRTSGATPIAMSRFGQAKLDDENLGALYAPHAVDTDVFAPGDRDGARRRLNLPDTAFVVGMVAANKGWPARKGWPQALDAFAQFHAQHPDAVLYLHTELAGAYGGVNLPKMMAQHKLPEGSVMATDQYRVLTGQCDTQFVRDVHAASDVLLNPAYGEGFGIPILEAQACGTPVIVTDWTAMPEVGAVGWRVGGEKWWTEQGSYWLVPHVDEIRAALGEAYGEAGRLRSSARAFALDYDHRRVFEEHWRPILDHLERTVAVGPVDPASVIEVTA